MAKEKIYWLGELVALKRVGGINIGGELYAIGDEIPVDKIEKDRLSAFRKAGCIGSTPFKANTADHYNAKDKDFALLQGRIDELTAQSVKDGDKIAGLELELEVFGDIDIQKVGELEAQVTEMTEALKLATDRIAELEVIVEEKELRAVEDGSEIERLAGVETDNEEKAALIKEQKAEIKALKKTIKDGKK